MHLHLLVIEKNFFQGICIMAIFTFCSLIVSITIIPKKAILQCMGINMMFYNQYNILKYLFAGFQVARVGGATIAGTAAGTARRAT